MRFPIWILILFCCSVYAGELEDFSEDLEYLASSYKEVKNAKHSSPIKIEFSKRILRAKDRAARMQRSLEKQDVRRTSLDTTLSKMLSFMPVDGVNSRGIETEAGSMQRSLGELRRQIKYLKEINYSYENSSLENPYPESDSYDAVPKFESLFKETVRLASGGSSVDAARKKLYEDNLRDLRTLAGEITRQIYRTKFTVPSGFNLEANLNEFGKAATKAIAVRARRDAAGSKDRKRLTSGKGYKESLNTIKYQADRIEGEIAYLRKANFTMRVRKTNLTRVNSRPVDSEDEITDAPKEVPFETLWKQYTQKKNKIFQSESKIRGVSEAFYAKYRNLLTPEQQKEMDSYCAAAGKQELPAEFARASAVKKMHTKYRFRPGEYSAEFLTDVLKKKD